MNVLPYYLEQKLVSLKPETSHHMYHLFVTAHIPGKLDHFLHSAVSVGKK